MKSWYCAVGFSFIWVLSIHSARAERPVVDDGGEPRVWFSRLRSLPVDAGEQFALAERHEDAGRLRRAHRAYGNLVARWPASADAARAQYRQARLLQARGRNEDAFDAYRLLLERYPHEVSYEEIMERQYRIALATLERRRMRFLFGGYQTPDAALPLFRWIVEQAPGMDISRNAQLKIASIHESAGEFEQAIDAYTRVLQLYPGTPAAAYSAVRRAVCLYEFAQRRPHDVRRLDEAAFGLEYALGHADSQEIKADLSLRLHRVQERQARGLFERARFYERSERNPAAAAIGYRFLLRDFPDTPPWSDRARARLRALEEKGQEQAGEVNL